MILQREVIDKVREWKVPPGTVDKDYVLGHFLSVLVEYYGKQLIFLYLPIGGKEYFREFEKIKI